MKYQRRAISTDTNSCSKTSSRNPSCNSHKHLSINSRQSRNSLQAQVSNMLQ